MPRRRRQRSGGLSGARWIAGLWAWAAVIAMGGVAPLPPAAAGAAATGSQESDGAGTNRPRNATSPAAAEPGAEGAAAALSLQPQSCSAAASSSSSSSSAGTGGTCGTVVFPEEAGGNGVGVQGVTLPAGGIGRYSNVSPLEAQKEQKHRLDADGVPTTDGNGAVGGEEEPFWKPRPTDHLNLAGSDDEEEEEGEEEYYDSEDAYEDYYDSTDEDSDEVDSLDSEGEDEDEDGFESEDRAEDLGVPQLVETPEGMAMLETARAYMRDTVMVDRFYEPVRALCKNRHESCAHWASLGECLANPNYMNVSCAPVCLSCEKTHAATRCPVDPTATDALYPGDLNRLFERAASDPAFSQLQPKVLSRPDYAVGDTPETADYQLGLWLLQFETFATPEECDRLVSLGASVGYNRSADVGAEKEDGTFEESVNSGRTSTNAWCDDACYADPLVDAVVKRMERLTGIPIGNAEQLQLLKYEPGQYYNTHNDYIPYQLFRPPGVRILTLFIYLSDLPDDDAGGETDFPRLGLKVKPKKGRAVLWPSVFDESPNHSDPRSDHGALPVLRGIKYGANAWYHQRDVRNLPDPSCL